MFEPGSTNLISANFSENSANAKLLALLAACQNDRSMSSTKATHYLGLLKDAYGKANARRKHHPSLLEAFHLTQGIISLKSIWDDENNQDPLRRDFTKTLERLARRYSPPSLV